MSFSPIIPSTGIVGWNFLQSTYDKQFETFSKDPVLDRETDYFAEKIGEVTSVDDLMADRRLLQVALGAYGLDDQIDMKALVEKVLREGSTADDALANKLGDDRWVQFAEAFGFGPGETPKTSDSEAMANISFTYQVQSFEAAVGEQDHSMRVAMYGEREMLELANDETSNDTKWYNVMGQPAIREMMETALALPKDMGQADIELQLTIFQDRASSVFGTDQIADFADPEKMEKLVHTYLARSQIAQFEASMSSASTALMLLR